MEDEHAPGRVFSLSHESVFVPDEIMLQEPKAGLLRHALSQDAINYVTVPVDELKVSNVEIVNRHLTLL